MKRKLAAVVITAGLTLGALASAASADPGTGAPTNPYCAGQDASYFAQTYGGEPNAAAAYNITVQQGHNEIRSTLCGRTNGLVPTG